MIRTISDNHPPPDAGATPPQAFGNQRRCPDCQTPVGAPTCAKCGLPIGEPGAATFWSLDAQLVDALSQRTAALQELRSRRTMAWPPPPSGPPSGRTAAAAASVRPTPERVRTLSLRDLLLAMGVFSLVVALVSFAVVSWDDLGTAARLAIVVAIAAIVGRGAITLFRRELHATAEAVTAVWVAILVADTSAIADLLSHRVEPSLTWTVSLLGVGMLLTWFTQITTSRIAPAFALVAIGAALPISGVQSGEAYWIGLTGLVSFVAVAIAIRLEIFSRGRIITALASATGLINWALVAVSTVWAVALDDDWKLALALVVGGSSIAAAQRFARTPTSAPVWDALAAGLIVAVAGTGGDRLANTPWGPVCAIAAAWVILTAALTSGKDRRGASSVSLVPIAAGALALLSLALSASAELFRFFDHPWTGTAQSSYQLALNDANDRFALAVLGVLLLLVAGTLRRTTVFTIGPPTIIGVAVIVYPVVFGVPAWAAATILGMAGVGLIAEAALRNPTELRPWRNGFGLFALTLASGAALADERLTLVVLAGASIVVWAFFVTDPKRNAVRVLGLGLVALPTSLAAAIAASLSGVDSTVGVWSTVAIALTSLPLLGGNDAAHQPLDQYGSRVWELSLILGLMIAMPLATNNDAALTIALSVVAVTVALHATRPGRNWLVVVAAAFAAAAALVQIEGRSVDLLEVFVLPVVFVGAVLGRHIHHRHIQLRRRASSTLLTWGPALFAALAPSTSAALGADPGVRPVVLPLVALVILWLGIEHRNRALVLAAVSVTVAIGLNFVITLATELPGWIPFAAIGISLLALGADFELSRDRARGTINYFKDLH